MNTLPFTISIVGFLFTWVNVANAQPPWFVCDYVPITNCNSEVPSLFVDLRGFPSYKWYSCEQDRGSNQDTCCGMSQIFSNERCLEFKILLDPLAEGFLFELINSGQDPEWEGPLGGPGDKDAPGAPNISNSGNSGNFEYRLNCDPNWYTAFDVICIDDIPGDWTVNDTLFVMFCMTGANDNLYRIKSLVAELDSILEDCDISLAVDAYSEPDPGWVSIWPNPIRDKVEFHFHHSLSRNVEIEIYHADGSLLKKIDKVGPQLTSQMVEIYLGNLEGGMYLYRVKENGKATTGKLVKL